VDRPTNGHRRHETGSITVVDLIRRQQGPVRIPSASEVARRTEEAETVQFVEGLLGPADDAIEHRGLIARGAKLAGLALGSLALCGSMVAAASLTHHRQPAAAPKPATATVLTGVGALRPDTVAAQLAGRHASETPAPPRQSVATGRAVGTIVGSPPPTTSAPAAPPVASDQKAPLSAAALVRAFYQLVRTDPGQATSLLDPTMLASGTNGFEQAWSSLSQVDIESIQQLSSDSVQAVIRMLQPDGSWLRVVELVHVTNGSYPLIDGAEVLSAQRG
jgi:hypothetical protein